jgi:actin-like ATPase involved in cell morphogenesis
MGVKVELTRDEIFEAIFHYVKDKYPSMIGTEATINIQNNRLRGAIVECQYKKEQRKPS